MLTSYITHYIGNYIIIDERFWVGISFVIFCTLSYPIFKKFFLKTLDQKILDIKNSIESSQQLVKDTSQKIKQLEQELHLQKQQSLEEIEKAKLIVQKMEQQSHQNINLVIAEMKKSTDLKLAQMDKEYQRKIYIHIIDKVYANVQNHIAKNQNDFKQISLFTKFDLSKFL